MKKTNYVILLLIIVAILILIDILTGIWYWNRLNLKFSSIEFNNIFTPIVGIIAIIIYYTALKTTQNQNKIINSHQLKDLFKNDIQRLIKEAKKIEIKLADLYSTDFLEFERTVMDIYGKLWTNIEFATDTEKFINISSDEIKTKSYYPQMLFLNDFSMKHTLNHGHYIKLQKLINRILGSKLIDDHKTYLLNELENELLKDYLTLVGNMKSYSKMYAGKLNPFSIATINIQEMNYKWGNITDGGLNEFYDWYQERVKNNA